MSVQDFKIGAINLMTFSVSFTGVEQWLKIGLLTVSIVYTVLKIIKMNTSKNE